MVLFFRIGKATLDSKELTNLEFYVRNAMKLDSDKTFTLIGSADKDTGNRELNQRLSEQRMEYVYDLLKNKYGVAPGQEGRGRYEQPVRRAGTEPRRHCGIIQSNHIQTSHSTKKKP